MAEVKRYAIDIDHRKDAIYCHPDGEFVQHSDYALLESDHEAAQAELTRLRAVEAAANAALDSCAALRPLNSYHMNTVLPLTAVASLAEACGRKG